MFRQKFAKIMIKCLRSHTKSSWNAKNKKSSISFFFARRVFQLFLQHTSTEPENVPQKFSSCNLCPFQPSVVKGTCNSFTELALGLNKKWTKIFRFIYVNVSTGIDFSKRYKREQNPLDTAPVPFWIYLPKAKQ